MQAITPARASTRLTMALACLAAAAVIASAGLLVLALLPHEALLGRLSVRVSPAAHAAIAPRLLLAGLAGLATALLAWCLRGRLGRALADLAEQAGAELKAARAHLRAARWDWPVVAWLSLATLAALGLRLVFLFQPMRYDESFTYSEYASGPIYLLLCKYNYPNNHVFHSLCVHLCCRAFGGEPWAIRLPALTAGLLLVPACYAAGRALFDRRAALLGAGLAACWSLLIEYSTNARGYALVALVFLLMLATGRLLLRQRTVLGWAALGLLGFVGFWTVPVMAFPYGAVLLWLAVSGLRRGETPADRRRFARCLAGSAALTVVLTALAYTPVVLVSGPTALLGNSFVRPLTWHELGQGVPGTLLSTWRLWQRDVPSPAVLLLGVGFLAGLCRGGRAARLVGATVLWCAVLVAARRVNPFERVWLFALPLYLLVAAAGLVRLIDGVRAVPLRRLLFGAALAGCLLLGWRALQSGSVYRSLETGTLRGASELAVFLEQRLGPGDGVLVRCPSDAPLQYYLERRGLGRRCLLAGADLPRWQGDRLFVVVNTAHGQTLDDLVARYRLERVVDLASARRIHEADPAVVFEFAARPRMATRDAPRGR